MSEGIVHSGILVGLGKNISRKIHDPDKQIITLTILAWFMSLFVNNVGVIGFISPTAQRMAKRANINKADFGLPIIYATFLGGSVTLISTVSNLIVSSFRFSASGQPFKMFDFAAHAISMSVIILLLWILSYLLKYKSRRQKKENKLVPDSNESELLAINTGGKRSLKNTIIVLASLLPAIILASTGLIHPSITFGFVVILWLATGIFTIKTAYNAINVPILLFLGSMFSISEVLNQTRALPDLIDKIIPLISKLPVFPLIVAFVFITAILSNILNNSVAALLMAPVAVLLFQSGTIDVKLDALLMAVAAGASLGIVIPTHQATIVAIKIFGFNRKDFIKNGIVIALIAGIVASSVIFLLWN